MRDQYRRKHRRDGVTDASTSDYRMYGQLATPDARRRERRKSVHPNVLHACLGTARQRPRLGTPWNRMRYALDAASAMSGPPMLLRWRRVRHDALSLHAMSSGRGVGIEMSRASRSSRRSQMTQMGDRRRACTVVNSRPRLASHRPRPFSEEDQGATVKRDDPDDPGCHQPRLDGAASDGCLGQPLDHRRRGLRPLRPRADRSHRAPRRLWLGARRSILGTSPPG